MTLHYHGTPITPTRILETELCGHLFCVSHAQPQQIEHVHRLGQGVMLDNGAFTKHTKGRETDWPAYYAWCDRWLDYPTTWAVIPDEIDAPSQMQDGLINEWPHGERGAPVYHMDEHPDRLVRLSEQWPRVCIGATGEYFGILSPAFVRRMDECWNALARVHRRTPNIHMLRGMQLSRCDWPFASLDSADVGRNHNRPQNTAPKMARRWDAAQCPGVWRGRPSTGGLFE